MEGRTIGYIINLSGGGRGAISNESKTRLSLLSAGEAVENYNNVLCFLMKQIEKKQKMLEAPVVTVCPGLIPIVCPR